MRGDFSSTFNICDTVVVKLNLRHRTTSLTIMRDEIDTKRPSPAIKLLNASVDPDPKEESELRILVNNEVKYLTIAGGVYSPDDMCFEPALISLLPPFPIGDWNTARISRDSTTGLPCVRVKKEQLPGITKLWHPVQVDYLELRMGRKLKSNLYEATCPRFFGPDVVVVAKFATFPWEVGYLQAETAAYEWIKDHDGIGPEFLGHLAEHGRVIGFVMARVGDGGGEGSRGCHHATVEDLESCRSALQRLHALGIRHGDINKHNFLVHDGNVTMMDFDHASKPASAEELDDEMERLLGQLSDSSGRGWSRIVGISGDGGQPRPEVSLA